LDDLFLDRFVGMEALPTYASMPFDTSPLIDFEFILLPTDSPWSWVSDYPKKIVYRTAH
jgi:hypothetical protein